MQSVPLALPNRQYSLHDGSVSHLVMCVHLVHPRHSTLSRPSGGVQTSSHWKGGIAGARGAKDRARACRAGPSVDYARSDCPCWQCKRHGECKIMLWCGEDLRWRDERAMHFAALDLAALGIALEGYITGRSIQSHSFLLNTHIPLLTKLTAPTSSASTNDTVIQLWRKYYVVSVR